jgi:hypothetical protein
MAADGVTRCLPIGEAGFDSVNVIFADSACTEAVAYAPVLACDSVAAYAVDYDDSDTCEGRGPKVYSIGSALDAPTTLYELSGGTCAETTVPPESQFYAAEELPPAEMVAGETEVVSVNDRLGVQMLVTADGARVPYGLWDLTLDESCSAQTVGPAQDRSTYCLGKLAYASATYSDDTCSSPVARSWSACGSPVLLATFTTTDNICYDITLYEVGEEVPAPAIHEVYSGTCTKASATGGDYFALGAPAAVDGDLELTQTRDGDTRLVLQQYSSDGDDLTPDGLIWDRELDAECSFLTMSDGKTYCVPSSLYLNPSTSYADAECEVPLVITSASSCNSSSEPAFVIEPVIEQVVCGSSPINAIYLAEKFEEDAYFSLDIDGNCVEVPISDSAMAYYSLGAEVSAAETFAEIVFD